LTVPRSLLVLTLIVAAALATGCRSPDGGFRIQRGANQPVKVEVQNHNFLDVTVFARAGGASVRLGEVTGKGSANLSIDPRKVNLASGLRLLVDPIGSTRVFLSETVFPDRGAVVVLQVGAELSMSHVSLRSADAGT